MISNSKAEESLLLLNTSNPTPEKSTLDSELWKRLKLISEHLNCPAPEPVSVILWTIQGGVLDSWQGVTPEKHQPHHLQYCTWSNSVLHNVCSFQRELIRPAVLPNGTEEWSQESPVGRLTKVSPSQTHSRPGKILTDQEKQTDYFVNGALSGNDTQTLRVLLVHKSVPTKNLQNI